jgi:hypothetical protein
MILPFRANAFIVIAIAAGATAKKRMPRNRHAGTKSVLENNLYELYFSSTS